MRDKPREPVAPPPSSTAETRPRSDALPEGSASTDDAGESRALTAIYEPAPAPSSPSSAASSPAPPRARPAPGTLPAPAAPPPAAPPRARAMTPLPPGLPVVAPYQTRPPTTSRPATPLPIFAPDATIVASSDTRIELATPTHIEPSPSGAVAARAPHAASAPVAVPQTASAPVAVPHAASAPIAAPHATIARGAERSEPIRVISMKPAGADKPRVEDPRVPLHVQLRSIAEVAGRNAPQELGNLAPPRDPGSPVARARTSLALWVCIGLAIAFAIGFAIWFVAGR